MSFVHTIFLPFLSLSALLSLFVGAHIYWHRGETIGGRWLLLVFGGQATWSLAYALQLTRTQASSWLFLEKFVVTGATVVVAGLLLFVLTYTGYEQRLSPLRLTGVLFPFLAGLVVAWTNPFHELFWQLEPRPEVLVAASSRYLQFTPGSVYTPWQIYLLLVVIGVLLMLGAKYVRSRSLHRAQVGLMFVGVLLPLVGNLLFTAVDAATLAIDITPVLFFATNLSLVVALKRYRMLDSVPISQHALLEQLAEGVIVTDEQAEVLHCNQAAIDMFGNGLVGERLDACLPLDRDIPDRNSPETTEFSTVIDGRQRHFDVNRTPYTDHRGEHRGAIFVFQDVTDREKRATELARQNERLDRFASVVSHDLQNPLHVAKGHLELARDESQHASDALDSVAAAHDRMETLIHDLLVLARHGDAIDEPEPVALDALADTCWQTVETTDATLATETEQTIRADPSRLRQLLGNLFQNATEHGGGNVTVTVGEMPDGFYVEDDGSGIPDDERDRVFDPGHSTRHDGTGIGLDIVETVARAHGWEITLTASDAGGARFEITGVTVLSGGE